MKKLVWSIFLFAFWLLQSGDGTYLFAQSTTVAPNFIQIPNLSAAPSCAAIDKGKMYFNSTSNKLFLCNGTTWIQNGFALPFEGTGSNNFGGQAGMVEFINTSNGNALYVKSGSGGQIIAGQAYAAYFESSQNGIFAASGVGNLALKTSGGLQLKQNGEAANKILTSIDASGTAVWQNTANLAGLEVNGQTTLGINGTAITEIIKMSLNRDIGNIAAGAEGTATFAIPNALPGSTVYCSPTQNLPVGVVISHALCEATGSVEVKFYNASNASIDPPAQIFHVTVIR